MAVVLFTTMGDAAWWLAARLAAARCRRVIGLVVLGAAAYGGVPARVRLPAARFLAPGRRRDERALERFAQEVRARRTRASTSRSACLLIAQDAYPALDVERYLGDIERMAIRLRARMPQAVERAKSASWR